MASEFGVARNARALHQALILAEEILKNIELSEVPLSVCLLKASRLARLLNDHDHQLAFEYEASGYPSTPDGVASEVWRIAVLAGRVFKEKEVGNSDNIVEKANVEAVEVMEERIATNKISLAAASDPHVSISSANPNQYIGSPLGNTLERGNIRKAIAEDVKRLASRRGFLHRYVSRRYDELRFSGIADDIFTRIRAAVDQRIGNTVPKAVQKFSAVYENLQSDNPEDWANAVHGCRRILQDLADVLFPASSDIVKIVNGKERVIKLGPDNYINRLIAFIEAHSSSERYEAIVGSNLNFVGDRLDAAFAAAQKGSHAEISARAEADRYVVYTYMIVADLLSLDGSIDEGDPVSQFTINESDGGAQIEPLARG